MLCERKLSGLFGKNRGKIRCTPHGNFRRKSSENACEQGISGDLMGCNSLFSVLSAGSCNAIPPSIRFPGFVRNQWHRIGVYKAAGKLLIKTSNKNPDIE
jgi:hypothetical protein